jgi:hypothetical protein
MELVAGCRNRKELKTVETLLSMFGVVWPEASEFALAYKILTNHRLANAISIPDCLISAMSLTRNAKLFTFNTKHFQLIDGITIEQPYSR